jgi:hypothetical protein
MLYLFISTGLFVAGLFIGALVVRVRMQPTIDSLREAHWRALDREAALKMTVDECRLIATEALASFNDTSRY